ncbi:MAG TPA: dihydroorotate dehydrogenase 2 [Gemmataceae bacterium]
MGQGCSSLLAWLLRLLPPGPAHHLATTLLRLPFPVGGKAVVDEFEVRGNRFRNRVGIAAGLDKNAACLAGLERLGAGFVEVGTVLVEPWEGLSLRPNLRRLPGTGGIWNRLGVPSHGLRQVRKNLAAFPRAKRRGLLVGCNIGPHPGNLKRARVPSEYIEIARGELEHLAESLFEHADFFVVNLSSPNTPGLRGLLEDESLCRALLAPVKRLLVRLDAASRPDRSTLLLLKLPPEDTGLRPWTAESLGRIVRPLGAEEACDGFVAVNTSARLALESVKDASRDFPGGVSGAPLHPPAVRTVELLRQIVGPDRLIIGCGGILQPEHALDFLRAGADLVELYSGLIYRGPGLVRRCAEAVKRYGGPSKRSCG